VDRRVDLFQEFSRLAPCFTSSASIRIYQELYFSKYIRLDPTTAAHCLADVGQLLSIEDIMPYHEFEDTR